jgi:DNA-3-methyladenine glycosylase
VRGRPPPTLSRALLAADTLTAARALLGARLVRDPDPAANADAAPGSRRVGRIVEVEAYIGEDDRASHARMGPTPRNQVMYGPPGIAYVYLVYGMHHCLNVVTEGVGTPAALLIRALEPIEGVAAMREARARSARRLPARPVPGARLAAGPGLVAAAFSIDRSCTGLDLCDPASPLRLEPPGREDPLPDLVAGPRVGVAYAGEPWVSVRWRWLDASSPSLSTRLP